MGLFLIKGTYHVVGYSPDGDSIRFKAANSSHWDKIGSGRLEINAKQHVQLRFQGIDALETHFSNGGAEDHQPLVLARQARDLVLSDLGITGVTWNAGEKNVTAATDGVPGYILARKKDENGRPLAFAYAGAAPEADGTNVFVDVARMQQSVNYQLIAAGLAYPFYFANSGLFTDLRNAMTAAVTAARAAGSGVYPTDGTTVGVDVTSTAVITDTVPLFPRLFRRLAEYLEGNPVDLSGFLGFLAAGDIRVIVESPFGETGFDNLIEVTGNTVTLTEAPENLLFLS